jgi:uroporphyrinogen decarboxylase
LLNDMSDSLFIKACRREPVEQTPVWIMRQAGRYMPEYRALREKHSFWEMCKTPDLAVEVTLQPVNAIGVDAAILFSDILVPVQAMGVDIEFTEGRGPVIEKPVRAAADIDKLHVIEPDEVGFVYEAIKILRGELAGRKPLIGFSGAPYTLASYIVEGGGSRNYTHIKKMMYNEPALYDRLMNLLTDIVIVYLKAQVEAGAQAVQMFESWASSISPYDYRKRVLPYSKRVLEALSGSGVPVIHFANGADSYLETISEAGGDAVGVDWRIDLDKAWDAVGHDKAIQGNMDPIVLLGGFDEIEARVKDILERAAGRPGHIFNLGHGILPETPVENAKYFVDCVHRLSAK